MPSPLFITMRSSINYLISLCLNHLSDKMGKVSNTYLTELL